MPALGSHRADRRFLRNVRTRLQLAQRRKPRAPYRLGNCRRIIWRVLARSLARNRAGNLPCIHLANCRQCRAQTVSAKALLGCAGLRTNFRGACTKIFDGDFYFFTIKNLGANAADFESHDLNREKLIAANSEIKIFIGPLGSLRR